MPYLVAQSLLIAMCGNAVSLLEMTGHQNASATVYAAGTLLNVTLNALLIPSLGIVGAASASLLSACLVSGCAVSLVRARLGIWVLLRVGGSGD